MSLTHFDSAGQAIMVDVSDKPATSRTATARVRVSMRPETLALVVSVLRRKGTCWARRGSPASWRPNGPRISFRCATRCRSRP